MSMSEVRAKLNEVIACLERIREIDVPLAQFVRSAPGSETEFLEAMDIRPMDPTELPGAAWREQPQADAIDPFTPTASGQLERVDPFGEEATPESEDVEEPEEVAIPAPTAPEVPEMPSVVREPEVECTRADASKTDSSVQPQLDAIASAVEKVIEALVQITQQDVPQVLEYGDDAEASVSGSGLTEDDVAAIVEARLTMPSLEAEESQAFGDDLPDGGERYDVLAVALAASGIVPRVLHFDVVRAR